MKEQTSSKIIAELLVSLVVTIIGGIFVAWYIKEGERFQSNQSQFIAVALTNHNCSSIDFYVDGEKVISSIEPNSTFVFKTTKGDHWINACSPATNACEDATLISWNKPASYTVERSAKCPITITISNESCLIADYYVDGNLVASAIAPNSTANFNITPGTHETLACLSGTTDNCGDKLTLAWTVSTTQRIAKSPSCP